MFIGPKSEVFSLFRSSKDSLPLQSLPIEFLPIESKGSLGYPSVGYRLACRHNAPYSVRDPTELQEHWVAYARWLVNFEVDRFGDANRRRMLIDTNRGGIRYYPLTSIFSSLDNSAVVLLAGKGVWHL